MLVGNHFTGMELGVLRWSKRGQVLGSIVKRVVI